MPNIRDALIGAYEKLLEYDFPDRHTAAGQQLLCDLRDTIAEISGRDAEDVQYEHEAVAFNRRLPKTGTDPALAPDESTPY